VTVTRVTAACDREHVELLTRKARRVAGRKETPNRSKQEGTPEEKNTNPDRSTNVRLDR